MRKRILTTKFHVWIFLLLIAGCTGGITDLNEPKEIRIDFINIFPIDTLKVSLDQEEKWGWSDPGTSSYASYIAIPLHTNLTLTKKWHRIDVEVNGSTLAFPLNSGKVKVIQIRYDRDTGELTHQVRDRIMYYY